MTSNTELHAQLELIRTTDPQGKLRPEAVVAQAADPAHPLHTHFEWDDGAAAHAYRIQQARQLIIRVKIRQVDMPEIRAYCSLTTDRTYADSGDADGEVGGYRSTVEVMGDGKLRAILLQDALGELQTLQRKYRRLQELEAIFQETERLQERHGRKKTKSKLKTAKKKARA